MIILDLDGEPVAQKRARFSSKTHRCYNPQKKLKEQYQWQIRAFFRDAPFLTPVGLDIHFFLSVPHSTSKVKRRQMIQGLITASKKPDLDNLQKFILDCMNGIIYHDDSQVIEMRSRKSYAEKPGTLIRIYPLTHEERTFANPLNTVTR